MIQFAKKKGFVFIRTMHRTVPQNHFDNSAKIHELMFELSEHQPHSPDLSPSDIHLLPDLKKCMRGKHFWSYQLWKRILQPCQILTAWKEFINWSLLRTGVVGGDIHHKIVFFLSNCKTYLTTQYVQYMYVKHEKKMCAAPYVCVLKWPF